MRFFPAALILLQSAVSAAPKQAGPFTIDDVPMPPGLDAQVGGLAALPDGRIAAAFHRGEIMIYQPKDRSWTTFAEGLHEPLGLLPDKDGSLLVMQRAELTRLSDTDGDGSADFYETVWDGFGMTGNYHEFAFGPERGPDGKLYVALNLASNGAGVREEVRGEFSEVGVPRERVLNEWNKVKGAVGRMYSRVPWRGWVMRIDPATGAAEPFACGFRSPDGLGFDSGGRFLVTDNQGDWRGTNELFVVREGEFCGHPASLQWRAGWNEGEPLKLPVARLNDLRTPAAVWFPYNTYANSPSQVVTIPKTAAWGHYGGQLLCGEMNHPRLFRLLLEEVSGVWQGACLPLIDHENMERGLHRLAFAGDTLWLGRTHLSWAGGEGLASLTPGPLPFDLTEIRITPKGFRLRFSAPLDQSARNPDAWQSSSWTYHYHSTYGSPEVDRKPVDVTAVTLSTDGTEADLTMALRPDYLHEIRLSGMKSAAGAACHAKAVAYTVRRVPAEE